MYGVFKKYNMWYIHYIDKDFYEIFGNIILYIWENTNVIMQADTF